MKTLALILTAVSALAGIASGLISGTTHLDGPTLAAIVGAISPVVALLTAKAALDAHEDEHHA